MEKVFVLNSAADNINIIDAINERVDKATAVASCFLAHSIGDIEISHAEIYQIIEVVHDFLTETRQLCEILTNRPCGLPAQ